MSPSDNRPRETGRDQLLDRALRPRSPRDAEAEAIALAILQRLVVELETPQGTPPQPTDQRYDLDHPRVLQLDVFERLVQEIEALRATDPERAKVLGSLGIRLGARLSNETFARAWALWATTCDALELSEKAEAARMLAHLYR